MSHCVLLRTSDCYRLYCVRSGISQLKYSVPITLMTCRYCILMPIKASQLVHSILGVGYVGDHDSAVNFNNASYIFIYTTKIKLQAIT